MNKKDKTFVGSLRCMSIGSKTPKQYLDRALCLSLDYPRFTEAIK